MSVFVTSDQHVGHYAVARMRYEESFPERAYAAAQGDLTAIPDKDFILLWHSNLLAHRWDSVVGKDDIVYCLGDLSMDGTANANNALAWIKARPGKKRFVPGNHDPPMPGVNRDAGKWISRYMHDDEGNEIFEWVLPYYRYKVAGTNVLMSHFPYQGGGDHTATERFGQYRLPFMGEFLLHGHTHSSEVTWSDPGYQGSHRQIHVGVDAHDYTPVSMDRVAEIIQEIRCREEG